ncbi:hypothetical protein [Candidatus Reidiella endopervernicosa]|uniref:hypothetical protein n=1 Tax=Candidatus Reidiella endopervernicosa TaxID=2738883 RepID=UPI003B968806
MRRRAMAVTRWYWRISTQTTQLHTADRRRLRARKKLSKFSKRGERVGLLLPNANATVVSLLGLQSHARIPAMLNYTAGLKGLRGACETAQINTVITSRSFIEKGKLEPVIEGLRETVTIRYLEDIGAEITRLDKLRGLLASRFANSSYRRSAGAVTLTRQRW